MCDTPAEGTDKNGLTCMTGAHLNESRVCAETEECHSALPARYGQWSMLCRVLVLVRRVRGRGRGRGTDSGACSAAGWCAEP